MSNLEAIHTAGPSDPDRHGVKALYRILALVILGATPFLVYHNSFQSPFVGDDIDFIERNQDVQKFSLPEGLLKLRPLNKFSYFLNKKLHGFSLPGYHGVNIALHAIAGILLFFLYQRLLQEYAPQKLAHKKASVFFLPLLGALLFQVHPIHTQAVNYTFARSELFCAVFLFSALFLHARKGIRHYGYGRGIAVSFFFLLALASKERAFMFVLTVALFDLCVRMEEGMAERKKRWRNLIVPMSLVVLLGLINFYIGFKDQHHGAIGKGREVLPFLSYFLTEMIVRIHYLKLYFWPSDLSYDYTFTIWSGISDPKLLFAIGIHIALLVLAVIFWRRDGRVSFGIFWFFLLILPTSGMVPAVLLMHEHWIYLSSFGLFLVFLVLWQRLLVLMPAVLIRLLPFAVSALVVLFGFLSFERNKIWQNPVSLWINASQYAPQRQWVWNNLGVAYQEQGEIDKALASLEKAEALGGATPASHLNIGLCLMQQNDLEAAEARLEKAFKMDPNRPEILTALGQLHLRKGNHYRAIDFFIKVGKILDRDFPQLYLLRAEIALKKKDIKKALKILRRGLRAFPKNAGLKERLDRIPKERP